MMSSGFPDVFPSEKKKSYLSHSLTSGQLLVTCKVTQNVGHHNPRAKKLTL